AALRIHHAPADARRVDRFLCPRVRRSHHECARDEQNPKPAVHDVLPSRFALPMVEPTRQTSGRRGGGGSGTDGRWQGASAAADATIASRTGDAAPAADGMTADGPNMASIALAAPESEPRHEHRDACARCA